MSLHLDLETCSSVDLRRTGVFRYAEDPTTDVICACFKRPHGGTDQWLPGLPVPAAIKQAVQNDEPIHAWNAQFESALWLGVLGPRYGWPVPRLEQFDCTMARSMYWGYPASLDMAGDAMGLSVRKDKAGHALMLRMCRPRAGTTPADFTWWHKDDQAKLAELIAYCGQDVRAEEACLEKLPPLPPTERRLWLLDQRMNRKGLPVDMVLVDAMQRVASDAEAALKEAMRAQTGGAVSSPNATAALLEHLNTIGCPITDLKRETVAMMLLTEPPGPARDLLLLRRDGSRASVAKLKAFAEAVCTDGSVKGMLRYYGAGRTGRWSGAGGAKVQPHNLVKGTISSPAKAIDMILAGTDAEGLGLLFEDSALGVIASCMRGCFACQ